MATLTLATRTKLSKLIPLLASDKPGEVTATASAMKRVLDANGISFIELGQRLLTEPQGQGSYQAVIQQQQMMIGQLQADIQTHELRIGIMNSQISELRHDRNELYTENQTLKARRIVFDFSNLKRCLFWAAVVMYFVIYYKGH